MTRQSRVRVVSHSLTQATKVGLGDSFYKRVISQI